MKCSIDPTKAAASQRQNSYRMGPVPLSVFCLLGIVCLIFLPPVVAADIETQLSDAAGSPQAIQRFVQDHPRFDWTPLWKALGIPDLKVPPCEEVWAWHICSAELIDVLDPQQTIVLLTRGDSNLEVFLRYLDQSELLNAPRWRFAGYFKSFARYFPVRHRVVSFGGAPFLAVTGQSASGVGISREVETWMDLRRPDLQPVFSYATEAHYLSTADGYVSREFHGTVTTLKNKPVESITLFYQMKFTGESIDSGTLNLGSRTDTVVFTKQADDTFTVNNELSTVTASDFDKLYGMQGDAFSCDDLVHYDFASLSETFTMSANSNDRKRLIAYLNGWCSDTPNKRKLNILLRSR